ncbi:MAG: class I SAM-dependent methyltransferase [Pseudobdellovibrionaceae bacterium]
MFQSLVSRIVFKNNYKIHESGTADGIHDSGFCTNLMLCLLCDNSAVIFYVDPKSDKEYFHCDHCDLRFLNPKFRLEAEAEKARYQAHTIDVLDVGHQRFVMPMVETVLKKITPRQKGLDFGSGPDSVLSYLLTSRGFQIEQYDPYFNPKTECINKIYDYILATEVIEHFYNPAQEFIKLNQMLQAKGALGIMTLFFHDQIDFSSWHYRNDATHVCFYSKKSIQWIADTYQFEKVEFIDSRTIWMVKP